MKMKKNKTKTKKWKCPKYLHIFMHIQGIVPTIRMNQIKERKMSMNSDERLICTECDCDSENMCNFSVNNINHVLNANSNENEKNRENETQTKMLR